MAFKLEIKIGNNEKYNLKNICNNTIYTNKIKIGYLLVFCYLIS